MSAIYVICRNFLLKKHKKIFSTSRILVAWRFSKNPKQKVVVLKSTDPVLELNVPVQHRFYRVQPYFCICYPRALRTYLPSSVLRRHWYSILPLPDASWTKRIPTPWTPCSCSCTTAWPAPYSRWNFARLPEAWIPLLRRAPGPGGTKKTIKKQGSSR